MNVSPRKVSSGNGSQQEHFYIPAQLYSSLVGKKNLILLFQGVSLPPFPLPLTGLCNEMLCHAMNELQTN